MKDIGQFKPIETGTVTEVVPVDPAKVSKDGKPTIPTKDPSGLSENDTLSKTDAQHAKLEHTVSFEGGQATTTPPTTPEGGVPATGSSEPPKTDPQETPTTGQPTTTKGEPTVPVALKALDQASMALVIDALNHCKEQNFKAAIDMLDKAIANHRKMLEEQAKQHKKEAPLIEARKQAKALEELRNKFIAEQAALEVIDSRKAATK